MFRLIGDVHGEIGKYINLVKDVDYSLQLGDMGFEYGRIDRNLNPEFHKIIGGNHDNYECDDSGRFVRQTPHFLGDFGNWFVPEVGNIFYVRGGASIDRKYRHLGIDWWPGEQLNYAECAAALKAYEESKPSFVVTHECPTSVIDLISTLKEWDGYPIVPSSTANLLQAMLEIHQPEQWYFGHHHKTWTHQIENTHFECLNILKYKDFK